ncbi:uncharacterized protein Liprin-beta isoform X3 [Periplaneta americana]|uniref:uncharacterized protein Liprin-beta isoform X3 n=1 Tax=Periplaneta americana TaxID=6978 RepID=UPI0037E7412B
MREAGCGGSDGEEGGSGVTVAAAVAILERQHEQQRRTTPSVVSRRQRKQQSGEGVSDVRVNKGKDNISQLQSRFGGGVNSVSPSSSAQPETVLKSGKSGKSTKRSDLSTEEELENCEVPTKLLKENDEACFDGIHEPTSNKSVDNTSKNEVSSVEGSVPENSEILTDKSVENDERNHNEICKSSSIKNLSDLVRSNSVVSTLNNVTLSAPKTQDSQDTSRVVIGSVGDTSNLEILSKSSTKKCNANKKSSQSNFSNKINGKIPGELQRSPSSKESLDYHSACDYDESRLGEADERSKTSEELQNSVKGSTSDSSIPHKRPRVINLRNSSSCKDATRSKSNPEVTSDVIGQQKSLSSQFRSAESASVRIVLEYPPPPSSSPPSQYGSPLPGGSPSSSARVTASTDSLVSPASPVEIDGEDDSSDDDDSGTCSTSSGSGSGTEHVHVICDSLPSIISEEEQLFGSSDQGGDESSPDEEEEDSTLKCSGTAWSGSDSAPHHRSSSTSDFSSSSSSEEEAEDLGHPSSHKPCRPPEDLTTTGCEEDFQWIHNSGKGGMDNRRRNPPVKKSDTASVEKRALNVRTPESDDSRYNHRQLDYDPPQIIQNRKSMTPSYEKLPEKSEAQSTGNDDYEYRQLISESNEVVHRKPPRHDSGLKTPSSFDKASSLDRRRHHSRASREQRDQKSRSSILLHSPRYRSPVRKASPSEHIHYNNTSCCMNHVACCDSATNLLRCSSSHECIHQPLQPTHCCSSSSLREDVMVSSYDSSFSENRRHHHHHSDLQHYGSAGKLDCHARMCHGIGSQQDLVHPGECFGALPQGDCYGSHGYLPLCGCQAEQRCRWRHVCKPPSGSDVEERLRRLEADKDSLQLQVTVLTEQIEVQTDKIADLEKLLDEKKRQLASAEDVLQREMLSRSSLETQKLELLSAMSELKLQQAALERDNLELRDRLGEERRRNKPPVIPRTALLASSTPVSSQQPSQPVYFQLLGGVSPSPSPVSSLSEGSPRRLGNHPNSVEDFKDIPAPRTPPANYRRKVDHYGSLPRQRATTNGTAVSPMDGLSPSPSAAGMRKGVAFGKGLVSSFLPFQHPHHQVARAKVSAPDKSCSTPNLAETERVVIEDVSASPSAEVVAEEEIDETTGSLSLSPQPSPSFQVGKSKGIKKIFGRMKRSGSGNLDDLPGEGEFRRGGVRATAGPRLGWTNQPIIKQKSDQPFTEWDSEAICRWLQELGLDCYAGDAKRWVKSGAQLLQASNHELEKELGIKNPLHRKKLHLALLSQQEAIITLDPHLVPAGELDTAWVLRWLDDAGLPQHKETFLAARIDGRVLHRLTMDELAILHVTSHLHVASLRRGIQVLRDHKFEANCLTRRSLPDDPPQPTAEDVALWTNHRVMEWLRVVDLAEYAPNLRGSGVHGGLMVHEPRFTAELLASLLSIPPSKTLLRRHLNTHFKELLGRECIQEKREAEATLGYVPLSATTKVKVTKKSQFTLKRKKSRSELDFGDLVCPLDPNKSDDSDGATTSKGRGCLS